MTTDNSRADALTEAVTHTIDTIGRQLDLIAERAPGNFLDKVPVVRSLTAHKKRLEKALATAEQHEAAPAGVTCARMGHGVVSIGDCFSPELQEPGIIFMDLPEPREIGIDTGDVFPEGSRAPADRTLAYVSFANGAAIDQTIAVLQRIKAKHFPAAAQPEPPVADERAAEAREDHECVYENGDGICRECAELAKRAKPFGYARAIDYRITGQEPEDHELCRADAPGAFAIYRASSLNAAGAEPASLPQSVLDALRFYANCHHFNIDQDHQQFDTVSGEPANWLFSERDDDCTMIEDGSVARAALCGEPLAFEDPVPPIEGEAFGAPPPPAPASAPVGLTEEQREDVDAAIQVLRQVEAGDGTFVGQCADAISGLEALLKGDKQ
ncbi:hypothetical protein [Burkholderia thailandensis]|uniref:hypothetical protein n=1 Tax=Burkholderia thailandensis TaxID=57975 RepID=UPI0018644CF2|nr:hypothetical protein [Burkholderia thailandensis]